ncbi:MAG: hypothetical protein QOG60_882, partial [Frankiaceae bacterium]|nr:hypothetical protein [Frankiaceae bacterium]
RFGIDRFASQWRELLGEVAAKGAPTGAGP